MKWVVRVFLTTLLLVVTVAAIAWYAFPWYAQPLIDRAVEGKNISIQVDNPGLPSPFGVSFGRLEIVFDTPPDSCAKSTASYTFVVHNGSLSWKKSPNSSTYGLIPEIVHLDLELEADSVNIVQEKASLSFSDSEPLMTGNFKILRKKGFSLELLPESFKYSIKNGTLVSNKLRFEGISYKFNVDQQNNWQQKTAHLSVASLHSGNEPVPLSNFEAWFGLEKDPENPCGITFKDCSVDLFDLRAKTPRIDYNPFKQETGFTLVLHGVPLEKLPGFRGTKPSQPFATGHLSGNIPVQFRNSILKIQNATIQASEDTKLMYYSLEGLPWLSIRANTGKEAPDLFRNLNATIAIDNENEKLSAIAVQGFSTEFLGGTMNSGPAIYDPVERTNSFNLKLDNVHLPEHLHLHGDFKGSMKGTVSGTVPFSVKNGKISISKALLSSKGNGSILHTPPRQKKGTKENILGTPRPGANYTYSEPDLRISRDELGRTQIDFTLKKLTRETSGGDLELLSPKGTLELWHVKNKPSLISLSKFSAGFMGGSIAIDTVDYDIQKKTAKTELILNNIPLQKLLDLQGMKKIYATGSIRGRIPVIMKDERFEIPAGSMDAEQTGKIIYSTTPEERAAANESMRLTYEALSNFFYSELVSSIAMNPDGESTISLRLKGVNPSFQEGRPVHLNLNIEQNLLDLMRSLTISTNIEETISEKALQKQLKKSK